MADNSRATKRTNDALPTRCPSALARDIEHQHTQSGTRDWVSNGPARRNGPTERARSRHERGGAPSSRRVRPWPSAGNAGTAHASAPCSDRSRFANEAQADAKSVCSAVSSAAGHGPRLGTRGASSGQGGASASDGHCKRPGRRNPGARKLAGTDCGPSKAGRPVKSRHRPTVCAKIGYEAGGQSCAASG